MKLKLEPFKDISILNISGELTADSIAIIKAGIKKLFKDGKNKIILEILDSDKVSPDVLREIALLNILASELSGQIVLANIDSATQAKIESFSKPPYVKSYKNRNDALQFFHPPEKDVPAATAQPAQQATPSIAAAAVATPPKEDEAQKKFKSDIRKAELGDVGQLRKKLSDLEKENKELKQQLINLVIQRRDPPDLTSWQTKVATLEKQLEEAVTQLNAQQQQKK